MLRRGRDWTSFRNSPTAGASRYPDWRLLGILRPGLRGDISVEIWALRHPFNGLVHIKDRGHGQGNFAAWV